MKVLDREVKVGAGDAQVGRGRVIVRGLMGEMRARRGKRSQGRRDVECRVRQGGEEPRQLEWTCDVLRERLYIHPRRRQLTRRHRRHIVNVQRNQRAQSIQVRNQGDMPRQPQGQMSFTPAQALYLIDRLVRERRITQSTVRAMAAEMDGEVRELEQRLAALRGLSPEPRSQSRRRRSSKPMSPETMASRRIQGQYLGLIRQVPATKRGQFKKIAREQGREAAIRQLRIALKK